MQLANATASQRLQLHKKLNFLHLLKVMQPLSPDNAMFDVRKELGRRKSKTVRGQVNFA